MGAITRAFANNILTSGNFDASALSGTLPALDGSSLTDVGQFLKLSGPTTATNVSVVDLTLSTDYKIFKLVIDQVEPAVDGGLFRCRFSVNGGSSFIDSSNTYSWVTQGVAGSGGDYTEHNSKATNYGGLTKASLGDQSDEGGAGVLEIIPNRSGLSNPKGNYYNYLGYRHDTSNTYRGMLSQGKVESSGNDIDAVRVFFDNGNIQTITYTLYGVKN